MPITRRIYVSLPADRWLPPNLNKLKWGIVEKIEKLGYTPEIFTNPKGKRTLASAKTWTPRDADEIARRCVGAVILGMPRWNFQTQSGQQIFLPTEFNHYEGALARTLGLPTLVLVQHDVHRRVVFDMTFGGYVGEFGPNASLAWLNTDEFLVPFNYWKSLLRERRDIFLGYCSKSAKTAANLKRLVQKLDVKILDWQTDFIPGSTILEQIQQAASLCTGAIFLFTKDDDIWKRGERVQLAPRDNVVFEAGYFIGIKGKRSVLIVRETGSKMPADLGGDIYASLPKRQNLKPIVKAIEGFVGAL